ncbi:MAG: hypothetical protein WHT09_13390 [Thermogutta sp.]
MSEGSGSGYSSGTSWGVPWSYCYDETVLYPGFVDYRYYGQTYGGGSGEEDYIAYVGDAFTDATGPSSDGMFLFAYSDEGQQSAQGQTAGGFLALGEMTAQPQNATFSDISSSSLRGVGHLFAGRRRDRNAQGVPLKDETHPGRGQAPFQEGSPVGARGETIIAAETTEPEGSRPLTLQERRFLEYLFTQMMPKIKQDEKRWAELLATLAQVRLYDAGARTEWYWLKNMVAQRTFTFNPDVVAITLGPDQFYRPGYYPSRADRSTISLIAHETYHSLHAQGATTGLFLVAYGIDSLAAWWYEGDPYEKNLSEVFGYAVERTVLEIFQKYPDALDWFDENSPRYGQIPAKFGDWVRKRFLENLNICLARNR